MKFQIKRQKRLLMFKKLFYLINNQKKKRLFESLFLILFLHEFLLNEEYNYK